MNGGANFAPALLVRLFEAARSGNETETARLRPLVDQIGDTLYDGAGSPSRVIFGIKAALSLAGMGNGRVLEPCTRVSLDLEAVGRTLQQVHAALEGPPPRA